MRKILIFLLPIWLFGTSCEEAIELSAEEFIKPRPQRHGYCASGRKGGANLPG